MAHAIPLKTEMPLLLNDDMRHAKSEFKVKSVRHQRVKVYVALSWNSIPWQLFLIANAIIYVSTKIQCLIACYRTFSINRRLGKFIYVPGKKITQIIHVKTGTTKKDIIWERCVTDTKYWWISVPRISRIRRISFTYKNFHSKRMLVACSSIVRRHT